MNLLVIDDEYLIVQSIVYMLDREALGLDKAFTAYSAEQGRKILEAEKVDILLVDVEMPKENGLELLEWMRTRGMRVTTLILSGHQRFDYAQQAIAYHCFNYLLKPVSRPKLNHELMRAVDFVRSKDIAPVRPEAEEFTEELLENSFVSQVRSFVTGQLSDPGLCRQNIADALHMNPDYLSHVFHREFGKKLTDYITEARIDQAKYLLGGTNLPVEEVAEKVGLPNISYFYRQFKKYTGMTPQQFRKN